MRRLLSVFLCLILTAQFSWAAVAGYHAHERGSTVGAHFDHPGDPHVHQVDEASQADLKSLNLKADLDHGHCHLPPMMVAGETASRLARDAQPAPVGPPPSQPKSHVPEGLERPNWRRC